MSEQSRKMAAEALGFLVGRARAGGGYRDSERWWWDCMCPVLRNPTASTINPSTIMRARPAEVCFETMNSNPSDVAVVIKPRMKPVQSHNH
jgi:hypothetical protein